MVVVDLWIAVAEVREGGLDAGHLRQPRLDEAQRMIGCREAAAIRPFDDDQKLWRVGPGEQARAHHRHQRNRQQQCAPNGNEYGCAWAREAEAQRRAIVAMDGAHQPLEQRIAMRRCLLRQDPAREERDHEQRDQQRSDDRCHYGGRQHADELARGAWQREQWQERKDQRGGAAQHGDGNLLRAGKRRLHARVAHPQMARDVFHRHDGVVHQQAEGHDETGDRQLVQ